MNMSHYPKLPHQQLEPITLYKKKQYHNRRDIRIKDASNPKLRQFDTLNSSMMMYEQMDNSQQLYRRPTTRNLTSVRKKEGEGNHHNNSQIAEQYESFEGLRESKNSIPKYRKYNPNEPGVLKRAKTNKNVSKSRAKNYKRQLNNYE